MAKLPTDKTVQFGCSMGENQSILVTTLDAIQNDPDAYITYVCSFYPLDWGTKDPWGTVVYEHHQLVCCAAWDAPSVGTTFRCVLSEEGYVRLYGPGGKPDEEYQIPDAGVWREGAKGYGYVSRIRPIGQTLYVCGDARQVYRFLYPSNAADAASLLKRGRFVHADEGMLQAPTPPAPDGKDSEAMDKWLDATDTCQFNDIAGTSESDIYATGDETWHYDGVRWQQLQLPVDDEPMHVIKVLNAQRVVLGGRNGYLLLGNAQDGFINISHHDDNHTITGLEWFEDRLFIATNAGLFTYDPQTKRQVPYRTNLAVDLVDTHLLEAKDGVLWSFGYKDLAYWDSRNGNTNWVRVHNPENETRVDEVQPKKARRQPPPAPDENQQALAASQMAALAWLPQPQANGLDVGALMARVGHRGVGAFVVAQLTAFGLKPEQVLRVNKGERYTVAVPKQGVALMLQCMKKTGRDGQAPEHWGLAEVKLLAVHHHPHDYWRGVWPGGLDHTGSQSHVLAQARALWDEEGSNTGDQQSFFVDGPHGAHWVINLSWSKQPDQLDALRVLHLGGYLPWPTGA